MRTKLIIILISLLGVQAGWASGADDDAREIFENAYNRVFGPEGCSLRYDVNLIGIYKTKGVITYKGKKNRFSDDKVDSWCDGKTIYMVYRKKKVIEELDPQSEKATKYLKKFKFTFDDFTYTKEDREKIIILKLKQKKSAKGTVKEAQIVLDAQTMNPLHARIKILFFWANIKISEFKAGNISDDTFIFPRQKYGSEYKYVKE